jgi:hypothetical protein
MQFKKQMNNGLEVSHANCPNKTTMQKYNYYEHWLYWYFKGQLVIKWHWTTTRIVGA